MMAKFIAALLTAILIGGAVGYLAPPGVGHAQTTVPPGFYDQLRMMNHDCSYAVGSLGTTLEFVIENPGDVTLTENLSDATNDLNRCIREITDLFKTVHQ